MLKYIAALTLVLFFSVSSSAAPKLAKHQLRSSVAIVGTNLGSFSNFNPEQPLLNIIKTVPFWNTGGTGEETLLYKSLLDVNGYPPAVTAVTAPTHTFTTLTQGVLNIQSSASGTTYTYHAGHYLLQWTGTASFSITGDATATCSVSPCDINIASPSSTGINVVLTCTTTKECTGIGSTSDYMHNESLIYCGTYSGGHCSAVDAHGVTTDVLETQCEAGTYTSCFNPDFLARMKGAKLFRFMQWGIGVPNSILSKWADRHHPTWFTFADGPSNLIEVGGNPAAFFDGIPYEYQIGLCNAIGADCYFTVPGFADDDFVTQLGTLAGTTLNSPLKAYVEFGNEWWNNISDGLGTIGTITAKIDNGSGSAGKLLNVTSIDTCTICSPSLPILGGQVHLVLSGAGVDSTTEILSQVSGTPGGIGIYNVSGDNCGNAQLVTPAESMTLTVNVRQSIARQGQLHYTSACADASAAILYGEYLRAVQTGHLFKAAFAAAGGSGSGSRVVRVAAGQNGCDPCNQGAACILSSLPSEFGEPGSYGFCNGAWGGPSEWYTGSGSVKLYTQMDAFALAPYFAYGEPDAWTADADGGLTKFFTEIITGGVEPFPGSQGDCGNGVGKTCTPVDTAHYKITSGLSLSSDPANGTMVLATANATNTLSAGQTFLTVDTMSQYPLLSDDGGCPGNNLSAGDILNTQPYVFTFTTAVAGCSGGGITKGWRPFCRGNPIGCGGYLTSGMVNDVLALAQLSCTNITTIAGASYPMITYEGGQTFISADVTNFPGLLYINAMRDSRMGTAYDTLFRNWATLTGGCKTGVFANYNNVFPFRGQFWGLLENILQTSSPRFDLVTHKYWGQP